MTRKKQHLFESSEHCAQLQGSGWGGGPELPSFGRRDLDGDQQESCEHPSPVSGHPAAFSAPGTPQLHPALPSRCQQQPVSVGAAPGHGCRPVARTVSQSVGAKKPQETFTRQGSSPQSCTWAPLTVPFSSSVLPALMDLCLNAAIQTRHVSCHVPPVRARSR